MRSRGCGPPIVYHCAGAAHVGQAWERTEATFATNVRGTHHLSTRSVGPAREARVLIPSSALVYRPANEPLTEDHPLVPASPYGVSKLAQELLGGHTGSDGVQVVDRAGVQPLRSAAGSRVLHLGIRAADRGDRSRDCSRPRSSSATSTRAAI